MGNFSNNQDDDSLFGNVVFSYSRQRALDEGVLIDAGELAKEAGFNTPVALTDAVWHDCVSWCDEDSSRQIHQDQTGRLWDVLYMAAYAIRADKAVSNPLLYQFYRVPRDGVATKAKLITLKIVIGPGDAGEPVITILLPQED